MGKVYHLFQVSLVLKLCSICENEIFYFIFGGGEEGGKGGEMSKLVDVTCVTATIKEKMSFLYPHLVL